MNFQSTAQLKEETQVPRPAGSIRALTRLRQRLRRLFVVDGVVACSITVCLTLLVTFVLDYLLQLPVGVRFIMLVAVVLYWSSVVFRRLFRLKRIQLSLEDLAVLVEKRNPELRQALVTAVQLTETTRRSTKYVSPQLISSVVADVEQSLPKISFSRIIQLKNLRWTMIGLVALTLSLVYAGASYAELTGIWFRRAFLLSNERWPKSVVLDLVSPKDNPVTIALGDDLPVEVQVRRGQPAEVEIGYWTTSSNQRTVLLRPTPDRVYRKVFEHVSEPFYFKVRGGDDELERVRVDVQLRPKISRIVVWCTFPPQTGKEPTPAEEPIGNGHLKVPEDTQVRFRAICDIPVETAAFEFVETSSLKNPAPTAPGDDNIWPPEGSQDLEVLSLEEVADFMPLEAVTAIEPAEGARANLEGSGFSGSFTVKEEGYYRLHLRGENGLVNKNPTRFRVRVIKDRRPDVRIREPRRTMERVSIEAIVPVELTVVDDYGIREGAIQGAVFLPEADDGKPVEIPLEALQASEPSEAVTTNEFSLTLDVANLGVPTEIGSRFQFYALAKDFGGNTGESNRYILHIASKEEILDLLHDRLMVVKDQVEAVQRQQESARKDLTAFHSQALLQEKIDAKEASKLSRNRQDQHRVTRNLTAAVTQIDDVLKKMDFNRVGEGKEKDWIGRVREALRDLAENRSPAVEKEIQSLRERATHSPQDPSPLETTIEKQRALERELNSIALRMTEFGDLNAIIQQWRDILRREVQIRENIHRFISKDGAEDKPN